MDEFQRWAVNACVDAKSLGEVIFEKAGAQPDRFAKFDWQQLGCWGKTDAAGGEPVGILNYYIALRRSQYTQSAQAAEKLPIAEGLGGEGYRLYFKRLEGKWSLVAYQSIGTNFQSMLGQTSPSQPVLSGPDFRARKGIWEVAIRAMEKVSQVPANTKCNQGEESKVICAPAM